ncbi:MAG: hypothetical protein MI867_18285, partial [Pseudomonadales bacterium]|nr:hypothetical protein [Pseudomonadales bacterium]
EAVRVYFRELKRRGNKPTYRSVAEEMNGRPGRLVRMAPKGVRKALDRLGDEIKCEREFWCLDSDDDDDE